MIAASPTAARFRLVGIAAYAAMTLLIARLCVATHTPVNIGVMLFIACSPGLAYAAIRAPIVFPFGVYVLLVPFDNLLQFGAFGTIGKLVAVMSAAALIVRILVVKRVVFPPRSWTRWLVAILWMSATVLWTADFDATKLTLTMMVQLFLFFTVLAIYPITASEMRAVIGFVVASGTFAGLYGLRLYLTGMTMSSNTSRTTLTDSSGNYVDPNHFAAAFLLPAALLIAHFFSHKNLALRVVEAGAIGAMFVGMLLSGSRDGLGAFVVVLVWLAIRLGKVRAMVVTLVCGMLMSIPIPTVWQRIADPGQGEAGGRFEIWKIGLHALHDHFLIGAGLGAYPAMYNEYLFSTYSRTFQYWSRPSHDLLLGTSVEQGFVGLALVLWAWWSSFRQNAAMPVGSPWRAARIGTEAALLGLFVAALFVDMLWFKYLWLAFACAALLRNVEDPRVMWPAPKPEAPTPAPSTLARLRRRPPPRPR